ncbi:MAG: DUF4320 family protein [Anaerotignaceae bacterium]
MGKFLKPLKNNCGEGYMDVVVLVICTMLVIALAVKVFPVYVAKQNIDTFATELMREAEICGRIGSETTEKQKSLAEKTGINPEVNWSVKGKVHLNEEIKVVVTYKMDIGLFDGFGSFPITLRGEALGKSEVYWK